MYRSIYVISFIVMGSALQGCGATITTSPADRVSAPPAVVSITPVTTFAPIIAPSATPRPLPTTVPPSPTVAPSATTVPSSLTIISSTSPSAAIVTPKPTVAVATIPYACELGKSFNAIFEKDKAIVQFPDKTAELLKQSSESGVLFVGGNITLLTQGGDAFVEEGGKLIYFNCKAKQGSAAAIQASAVAVANVSTPIAVAPPTTQPTIAATAIAAATAAPAAFATNTQMSQSFYACDGNKGFRATFFPAGVMLDIGGSSLQMRQVQSASGRIWSNDVFTLVIQGNYVFVEQNGIMTYTNCRLR